MRGRFARRDAVLRGGALDASGGTRALELGAWIALALALAAAAVALVRRGASAVPHVRAAQSAPSAADPAAPADQGPVAERKDAAPIAAQREELQLRLDVLERELHDLPAHDLDALEARTLLSVFAAERQLTLGYVTPVEADAGRGVLAFAVHGEGTLEAWLDWLDLLDAQGLAPAAEQFRLERDAPDSPRWRASLRVAVGTSDLAVGGR
jgi:hypothetical protein